MYTLAHVPQRSHFFLLLRLPGQGSFQWWSLMSWQVYTYIGQTFGFALLPHDRCIRHVSATTHFSSVIARPPIIT